MVTPDTVVDGQTRPSAEGRGGLSLDTLKDKYNKGTGASAVCPRRGHVLLQSKKGVTMVNTNCNSWRCVSCRDRNLRRFKTMVRTGILAAGKSAFITVTYKAGSARLEDAGCVQRDWMALQRIIRQEDLDLGQSPWIRVMELTKKGTPHLHVVLGSIKPERRIRCFGSDFHVQRYLDRFESCECIAHLYGRAWRRVTKGTSFIVHAVPIGSAQGAASYLAKYMQKTFDGERSEELGMKRRWSKSNNWPSEPRARLEETKRGQWTRHWFKEGHVEVEEMALTPGVGVKKRSAWQEKEHRKAMARTFIKTLTGGQT